jgi:hypothetical protein
MASWVYDKKFPVDTQFLFGTLMWEDGNLELQVWGPPPHRWAPIYGKAPYGPTGPSSTTTLVSDGIYSSLNHYARPYVLVSMMS